MTHATDLAVIHGGNEPESYNTITEAFTCGTSRDVLRAIGVRVAQVLDAEKTQARDMASLSKRLMEITTELENSSEQAAREAGKRVIRADQPFRATAI